MIQLLARLRCTRTAPESVYSLWPIPAWVRSQEVLQQYGRQEAQHLQWGWTRLS